MAEERAEQLDHIADQLSILVGSKSSGITKASFWAGILLTILGMVVTITLTIGGLERDLNNHLSATDGHISSAQKKEITLNTQHRYDATRDKLDLIYAKNSDLEQLDRRVTKLEDK